MNGDHIQSPALGGVQANKAKLRAGQVEAVLQGGVQDRFHAAQGRQFNRQVIKGLETFIPLEIGLREGLEHLNFLCFHHFSQVYLFWAFA